MLISLFIAVPAVAHEGATGVVKERMDLMKSLKDDIKALGAMAKGDVTFDQARIKTHAQNIAAHGGTAMTKQFPEGSLRHPSEALPAVWKDWARFKALADEMTAAADALAVASADGSAKALGGSLKKLGGTCKACHDDFRQKK